MKILQEFAAFLQEERSMLTESATRLIRARQIPVMKFFVPLTERQFTERLGAFLTAELLEPLLLGTGTVPDRSRLQRWKWNGESYGFSGVPVKEADLVNIMNLVELVLLERVQDFTKDVHEAMWLVKEIREFCHTLHAGAGKLIRELEGAHQVSWLSSAERSFINSCPDPLIAVCPKGKIIDLNPAAEEVLGSEREKLVGAQFRALFTDKEKAEQVYRLAILRGKVTDYELVVNLGGASRELLFNAGIYKDEKGHVLGAMISGRDITELKQTKTELKEARDLAEVDKQRAEGIIRAKQQFLSNMSHEIRTPMNAIIGFAKVVLRTELTPSQQEYLNAIRLSGEALLILINDILDLAKVDAGRMAFERAPFRLVPSVSAMIHLFELKIGKKKVELVKDFDHALPRIIIGDAVRLHQVMLNLLSNAVRHTPSGTITIKLRLLDESPDKVRIEFSVTDTGSGIPESRLKTIFSTPSVNTGTPNLYAGTGLGLSIVKHLVEGQGGSVSVSSEVGKGSSFCFVLDFLKADEKIEAEMEMTEHLPGDLSEIRVLVAEDVALNQLLMKTLLTGWGFSFEIVDNGKMAIEKMRTGKFDIVLMDIQMPEMNGFEATRSIRTELRSDIPIIALTADVTDSDLNRCRAVGMNDYMAKPVDDKLLYRKIISLVNARRRKAVQLSWNGASMTGPTAQQQGK